LPRLCITVGRNVRFDGISIEGSGVSAVTVFVISEASGSSLVITRVQLLGPSEVGVKRITRFTQESGLTVAGKGLLIMEKSEHAGSKATLVTARLHFPTL
jgi:hypothetical protein